MRLEDRENGDRRKNAKGQRKPQGGRIHREGGYDSRRRSRRKKPRQGRRSWVKWVVLAILILAVAAAIGSYLWIASLFDRIPRDESLVMKDLTNPNIDMDTQRVMRENWTIAVFGVDSADGNLGAGANADVIMLCNINEKTGAIRIASIYRDTCMKVGERNPYKKINEAYARGGIGQAVTALNENLDIEIDDYLAVNWKAVADAINLLGGIEMDITEAEFQYINAYITNTVEGTGVGSYQLKSAGPNHLDGVQAVAYARLRYMDTDFQRTERQRKVLDQVLEKAKSADWSTLNNILVGVLPQTKSSFEMDSLIPVARGISKFHLDETTGFPFDLETKRIREGKRSIDYVFPLDLESNVIKLHQFLYGTEDYKPSEQVKKISRAVEEKRNQKASSGVSKSTAAVRTTEAETEETKEPATEVFDPTAADLFTTEALESLEGETEPGESHPGSIGPGESQPRPSGPGETGPSEGESRPYGPGESQSQTEAGSGGTGPDGNPAGDPWEEIGPGITEATESEREAERPIGPGETAAPSQESQSPAAGPGESQSGPVSGPGSAQESQEAAKPTETAAPVQTQTGGNSSVILGPGGTDGPGGGE